MALSKIQPASMDLTANYAFTGTNSVAGLEYAEKKLATVTASSSSTLDFTSNIDSTYNIYRFRFVNLHPSAGTNLQFNGSIDTGSNYNVTKTSSFFQTRHDEDDDPTQLSYETGKDLAQGTGFQWLVPYVGNGNDECSSGELWLFNPSSTTFVTHFFSTVSDYTGNDNNNVIRVGGYFNTASAINAIQFKQSSGTMDAGRIALYGIK